jgi:hypothetical protein
MRDPGAAPPAAQEWPFAAGAVALYFALGVAKMRTYLLEGRFWGEEASIFYEQMVSLPFLERVFFVNYGHLMLPANVVVALSVEAPLAFAPLVTTHLSFLLQSIPVFMLAALRRELGLERWALAALVVVIVGLPQAPEVWANSVNLHFHFSLAAALVALAPTSQGWRRHASRALLLVAGLSGVPANFLVPVFLGLALGSRERERWIQFGILAATAAVQLGLMLGSASPVGPRTIAWDPRLYWLAIVSQQTLSPLFGVEMGDRLAHALRRVLDNHAHATLFALFCSLPLFAFAKAAISRSAPGARVTFAAAALLTTLAIAGSIGDKASLVSANGGGRYFFAANVLVAVFVLRLAAARRDLLLRTLVAILLVSSAMRSMDYLGGPSWRAEYEAAMRSGAERIGIWPPGWSMRNPRRP